MKWIKCGSLSESTAPNIERDHEQTTLEIENILNHKSWVGGVKHAEELQRPRGARSRGGRAQSYTQEAQRDSQPRQHVSSANRPFVKSRVFKTLEVFQKEEENIKWPHNLES